MARTDTLTHFLTDVASAIKTKKGSQASILASNFDTEIANLPSGGGSSKSTVTINIIDADSNPVSLDEIVNSNVIMDYGGSYWNLDGVFDQIDLFNNETYVFSTEAQKIDEETGQGYYSTGETTSITITSSTTVTIQLDEWQPMD